MKFFLLMTTGLLLMGLPSCEKVRTLKSKLEDKLSSSSAPAKPYSGSLVSELTESGYPAFSQQPGRVIIVDFYADWCGPCRKLGPILHDIATDKQGLVLVGKVNVDDSPALAAREGVQGIPDVRIFRDGKQVDRFVGLPGASEVRRRIEKQLAGLPPLSPEAADPANSAPAAPVVSPGSKDWLPSGMQRR